MLRENQQTPGDAGGAQGPPDTAVVGIDSDLKMTLWGDSVCLEQMRLHAAAALPGTTTRYW